MPLSMCTSIWAAARWRAVDDGRQCPDRRQRAIELPPAVVRHDDGIRPHRQRHARIVGIKDALEDHLAAPHRAQLRHPLPVERQVERLCRPA